MRRSTHVFAPLLASAAALFLTGCHHDIQSCVDENNHVVDPSFCKNLPPGQTAKGDIYNNGGYYNQGIFYPHIYRNYYGGSGGGILGGYVSGGSYTPVPGHSYSIGGTSRGGFGSSFGGDGGGHGAGE